MSPVASGRLVFRLEYGMVLGWMTPLGEVIESLGCGTLLEEMGGGLKDYSIAPPPPPQLEPSPLGGHRPQAPTSVKSTTTPCLDGLSRLNP